MGKRKERRLAALSNAARRVKLDLFAPEEPSALGDLGGSSVHGKVGGDIDPTQHAGSPNSPSSSGQQPQNPLSLLTQYNDDELNEESKIMPNHDATENSPDDLNDEEPHSEEKDADTNTVGYAADQKVELQVGKGVSSPVDVLQSLENCDSRGVDAAAFADVCNREVQVSDPDAFHAQLTGDISMGWRMVMHEETNQYYYWNVETGETSWEPPGVLVQSTSNEKVIVSENTETAIAGTNDLSSNFGGDLDNPSAAFVTDNSLGVNLIPQSESIGPLKDGLAKSCKHDFLQDKNLVNDAHQSASNSNTTVVNAFLDDGNLVVNVREEEDENERAMALSTSLTKQCECLLERLKSLKGHENGTQNDQILKYILETEIRLSDLKSLSTYGSPLLPFWTHSEERLKRLEEAINIETYQLAVSAQLDGVVEANGDSNSKGKEKLWQSVVVESEEVNETAHLKPEIYNGEDVDMDVDMEIEDGIPTSTLGDALTIKEATLPSEFPSLASADALSVLPPPEEEWIPPPPPDNDMVPPPPPDNEQLPPPPPDEPPESSYSSLPPYAVIGQPTPFTEQYNSLYPASEFQYYGHPLNLPSSNLYGHADGSQVALPSASVCYETPVASAYAETAAVIVGPAESSTYNNLQGGTVLPVPVVRGVESSQLFTKSSPLISKTLSYDPVITVDDSLEARPSVKHDIAAVGGGTGLASAVVPSTLTSAQASTSDMKGNISVPSTDTAPKGAPAPSTTASAQSKVIRSKKRTVAVASSLRSNKKVSSLVDKWKAAKEELNDNEEDEPENPYEILEKKRQKEIEEWYTKQIASGEARDNANFQPLGGDWRERVKRRRAQVAKEAAMTSADVVPTDESQQPDLAELSKGLPSGWQAYWDEGLKQIYYGNPNTLETTWTRPAK